MEIYRIIAENPNTKEKSEIRVEVCEDENSEDIIIRAFADGYEIAVSDYNYFPAFQKLRDSFLEKGVGLKCCGALINAVQSGMMGADDKIYLVKIGKKAFMKDIVHIWDYAETEFYPDTKQQNEFFEKWIKSI